MITIETKGSFKGIESFFIRMTKREYLKALDKYGKAGVAALASATPRDTGKTAGSWYYEVSVGQESASITFYNSNVNQGVNIAIILQYGHGTRTGGYVQGRDYINPAIQPVFDKITEEAWKEVTAR